MGRYKSLLKPQIDAKRFEHAVDLELDIFGGPNTPYPSLWDWCKQRCHEDQWADHTYMTKDHKRFARFYFIYPNIADHS